MNNEFVYPFTIHFIGVLLLPMAIINITIFIIIQIKRIKEKNKENVNKKIKKG
jgi:hypothetical protein